MSKRNLSLLLGFSAIWCLTIVFSSKPIAQVRSAMPQKENATLVEEGVMTARQKEHAKLFGGDGSGTKLIDLAKQYGSINSVIGSGCTGSSSFPSAKPTREESMRQATCDADASLLALF